MGLISVLFIAVTLSIVEAFFILVLTGRAYVLPYVCIVRLFVPTILQHCYSIRGSQTLSGHVRRQLRYENT